MTNEQMASWMVTIGWLASATIIACLIGWMLGTFFVMLSERQRWRDDKMRLDALMLVEAMKVWDGTANRLSAAASRDWEARNAAHCTKHDAGVPPNPYDPTKDRVLREHVNTPEEAQQFRDTLASRNRGAL